MSSTRADVSARLSGNEQLIVAVVVGVVLFGILAIFLGFGGVLGLLFVLLSWLVGLAITALVIWLFYRLVVAVEGIADAQKRIARSRERREVERE